MSAARPAPLGLIWAQSRGGVIGQQGRMPWHLPEDLAHFRRVTADRPVIMGRKTWDSLPPRFRPLPGRQNIVLTRQTGAALPGAFLASDLPQALALCPAGKPAWVIGGAQIYAQALPLAQQVWVTEIDADFPGDAYAPALDPDWQRAQIGPWQRAACGLNYRFVHYLRP